MGDGCPEGGDHGICADLRRHEKENGRRIVKYFTRSVVHCSVHMERPSCGWGSRNESSNWGDSKLLKYTVGKLLLKKYVNYNIYELLTPKTVVMENSKYIFQLFLFCSFDRID